MARVDIFAMTKSIANESISHPDVKSVTVNAVKDIPKNATNDPKPLDADNLPKANDNGVKTTEPGPENGGGDGTAEFTEARTADTNMDVADVNKNLKNDQNGGRHIDTLPNQVKAKDGLSASDVRTSVEEHAEGTEESGLKSIDAAGAEAIEKADDMVMDLDGEELQVVGMTDVTESKLAEIDSVVAKSESLSKATATVERYCGLLNRMKKEGRYMSDELRQSISWALEDIDGQMFYHERVALEAFNPKSTVSLEANGMATTPGSSNAGSIDDGADPGEVGKGLGSKFKKLFDAGIKIIMRLVNMVSDLVTSFVQDVGKIKQHLVDLRKRCNVLEGGTEFKMKGAGRLVQGDEFVGDSKNAVAHVHKVASELLMTWPTSLVTIIQKWEKGDQRDVGTIIDELDTALERGFRSFERLNSTDRDKVPSGFLKSDSIQWSGPMPGNMALYYGVNKSNKGDAMSNAMEEAGKAANINFSLIPGANPSAGDIDASTPSSGEAVSVIRELEKLCQFVTDAREGMSKLKTFAQKAGHDGFMNAVTGRRGGEGQITGIIVLGLVRTSTESQHRFIGYLINLIKGYIGFLEASLKTEAGGREDIQGN